MSQWTADVVGAARLGIRGADREVDGAADLLVEEDRPDRPVDAEVRADAELAEPARALVGGERRPQVVLALARAGLHHAALAELELDPLDRHAARARGQREAGAALGGRLDRPGEDLAARHVALAVGVDPGAPGDLTMVLLLLVQTSSCYLRSTRTRH